MTSVRVLCRVVRLSGSLIFMALFIATSMVGQDRSNSDGNLENSKSTMRKLYEKDQEDLDNEHRAKFREQVQELMRNGKIQTAEDYYYAAFIFQHGLKPSDYLYAHVLAVTAVNKGLHNAMWLSAATLDRYLQSLQQPQIFGTQFGDDQEPYARDMLSDQIRGMWCVAPQAAQSKILADEKAGKGFTSTRTCPLPDAQFDTKK